jgi:hypothetical protein
MTDQERLQKLQKKAVRGWVVKFERGRYLVLQDAETLVSGSAERVEAWLDGFEFGRIYRSGFDSVSPSRR